MSEPIRECDEHEFLSICCGAPEGEIEGLCPKCRDWTSFECSCGKEQE